MKPDVKRIAGAALAAALSLALVATPASAAGLLALGDSFSSGQGAGAYEPGTTGRGNTCFRSPLAWPHLLARDLRVASLPSLACGGAVLSHVISDSTRGQLERRKSQISRIAGDPDLITITIGGNDVGFGKVLRDCSTPIDCSASFSRPTGDILLGRIRKLERELPAGYRAVRSAAPRARLVVVGYPRLFPDAVPSNPSRNCAAWILISRREAAYLNRRTRSLNAAIARAARAAGVTFVDVAQAFDGRELRCEGPTFMNRLHFGKPFRASFHPNADGHARLAQVVADRLTRR